jgi:sigma-B regulation protein RsbU (phosphoserine phosphatase)
LRQENRFTTIESVCVARSIRYDEHGSQREAGREIQPRMNSTETSASKILVVDDEASVRDFLRQILTEQGYAVSLAEDGVSGLETALREKPDLIILDLRMPKMDGVEMCRQVRASPAISNCQILVLTSLNLRDQLERSIEAGADDFVSKPFNMTELNLRIHAMLKLRHVSGEVERLQKYIVSLRGLRGAKPDSSSE